MIAKKMLEKVTAKLLEQKNFRTYDAVFKEWEDMGIIEIVPDLEEERECHYLPHRPVYKPDSSTTKVRPVFDASCATGKNPSLNQCIEKGPNMLELIPDLLLRFRQKPVGATADIKKAFLMINVNEKDQEFLRFLWWESEKAEKLKIYRHRCVVFGVNCSPFLLGAVINHHLECVLPRQAKTAKKLIESLYVDNVVAAFDTEEDYNAFKIEATSLLKEAKFDLRMWESNVDKKPDLGITHVLGIKWDRKADVLFCSSEWITKEGTSVSKRSMLSAVARIFDPLGLLSPVTLVPKMCLQETWSLKLGWDDAVPPEISRKFTEWSRHLNLVELIKVPRFVAFNCTDVSVHTFCDASVRGYAAAIFLRSAVGGIVQVQLLMAKARVAPMKVVTINRLELIACEIGTRIFATVSHAMKLGTVSRYFWMDSSTALAWISRNDKWGLFVGNRVSKILKISSSEEWRHVHGHLNPANLPSRGCSPRVLLESRWWCGPVFLKLDADKWPTGSYHVNETAIHQERKKEIVALSSGVVEEPWYSPRRCRFSEYSKIVRVMAYVMRFIYSTRGCRMNDQMLGVEELEVAERKLLLQVQKQSFKAMEKFPMKVKICAEGLLRVETKIVMRKDTEDFRRPILLPSKHCIVDALIREQHLRNCHAGVQFLMSNLRKRFWILKGRKSLERIVSKCIRCRRFKCQNLDPETAPLPLNRVRDAYPYEIVGIDLAGPLYLKDKSKVWVVLYTCGVFRALHLELVSSLSTEVFLMSLRRFVVRNGRPYVIYTDNGTNFTGAARLLSSLDWKKIQDETSVDRMWAFSISYSPWWGGWWERLVRTMKELLVRILGSAVLDFEELNTVLCDVEAVINGRPLTYVFENDTLVPLTPLMFTRGIREAGVPDLDTLDTVGFQKRHRFRQRLLEDLRNRFRKEYLGMLIQRSEKRKGAKLKVGDIVLIGSEKKRLQWLTGRITEIIAGRDGVARVAKVKTSRGEIVRSFQRLYPLEVADDERKDLLSPEASENCVQEEGSFTRFGREIVKPKRFGFNE